MDCRRGNPMIKNQEIYETKITDLRWIAYDIPGNIGWIAYFTGMMLCFVRKPDFMQYGEMEGILILSVVPAVLMAVGIIELISERIHKLDRVLPKKRLLRGFGALALGGITGMLVTLFGILYGVFIVDAEEIVYLIVMLGGALLCAVFAGLLYKGYTGRSSGA